MAVGTLLFGLALFILIALVVSLPFFDRQRPAVRPISRREELEQERASIIREIRELDFDHRTGKVNDEDYKQMREARLARGALILRELAALKNSESPDPERTIEAEVARLRTALIANGKAQGASTACPHCNQPVRSGDKFCPQCGARLRPQQEGVVVQNLE
jgi:NADH pyrophosphatase NudC (nudix superfamily)